MVVNQVDVNVVAVLEAKDDPQGVRDVDRPESVKIALERMQAVAGDVHLSGMAGAIKQLQNAGDAAHMGLRQSAAVAGPVVEPQPAMSDARDHARTVGRSLGCARVFAGQELGTFASLRWNGGSMRRSGGVRGVVALVLAVALGAGVFAGCGGEAEPPGIAPSALEHRDTPRAVTAEEEPQQEAEPAFKFATVLAEQNTPQTVYTVLDGEGGIHQVFTRGVGSGFTLLRVSADEYRCSITVRQSVSDEAAGHFALRFSEIVATGRSGGQARQNES